MKAYNIVLSMVTTSFLVVACGNPQDKILSTAGLDNPEQIKDGLKNLQRYTTAFPNSFVLKSLTNNAIVQPNPSLNPSNKINGATTQSTLSQIDSLLNGKTTLKDIFTPELLYSQAGNARCYGPNLAYKNHPDVTIANSGVLPGGDLGIWTMNEGNTSQACSAAQLNSRMNGVSNRTKSGLFLLASSLDAMYDANKTLPEVGEAALDVTANMPSVANVTFNTVNIEQISEGTFNYKIDFTYTRSGSDYDIKFETTHVEGASENEYKGHMKYEIQDSMIGGNCARNEITRKGSLTYERDSEFDFKVDSREADFCTHNFGNGFDANDSLEANYRLSSTHPDGWGNNYSSLISNYDAQTQAGQYSYVWQAGPNDAYSRTLQIDLNDHSPVDGESYFGYAAQVFDTNATLGENVGMICNWTAPGATASPQLYVQRQFLTFNSSSNFFETTTSGSNITYAPTNSCQYDGNGTFEYDRNLDSVLNSSDIAIVKVGASRSSELEFDLFDYNGSTVAEMISNRGAHLPVAPLWP